jgi:pilus assembly protein CpaE
MTEFFLVHRDPEVIASITQALATNPEYKLLGHASTGQEGLFYLSSTTAKCALVQLSLPDMDGFEFIRQVMEKYPDIYLVPILEGNESGEVWQRLLQLNMRDVINGFMDQKALLPILKSAAQRSAEQASRFQESGMSRGRSYMVTVASARGGTGKSVFAANLAISMAKNKTSPLLVDYSMYAGDFFTMLDHVPRNTVADAISQGQGIDQPFLKSLVADHPLGFRFLACPNQDFEFYSFDYDSARNLLKTTRGITEFSVIDTGAYDLPCTMAAVDEADLLFLVTTRDLSRLLATQRFIKSMRDREVVPAKIKVIVNNAEVGTEISETEVESILEHEVTAYLPSCPLQTTFSINSGKPLAQAKADLPFCKVIYRLAELCIQRWQVD